MMQWPLVLFFLLILDLHSVCLWVTLPSLVSATIPIVVAAVLAQVSIGILPVSLFAQSAFSFCKVATFPSMIILVGALGIDDFGRWGATIDGDCTRGGIGINGRLSKSGRGDGREGNGKKGNKLHGDRGGGVKNDLIVIYFGCVWKLWDDMMLHLLRIGVNPCFGGEYVQSKPWPYLLRHLNVSRPCCIGTSTSTMPTTSREDHQDLPKRRCIMDVVE
jgi:hypothetical protein